MSSKVIRIDGEVYAWLQSQAEPLRDNPNSVLRRIAGLPSVYNPQPVGPKSIKLTPKQVVEIRKKYAKGKVTMTALAKEYGVGPTNILLIIHRKTWAHLSDNGDGNA